MTTHGGILSGVRVLELAHMVAGPTCGVILADLGATVTKIELPPAGDLTRAFGPGSTKGTSALFAAVNRSKTALMLDPGDPLERARIEAMIGESDVLVTNLDAGRLAASELDAAALVAAHPGLVYVQITAFGGEGRPGTDSRAATTTRRLGGHAVRRRAHLTAGRPAGAVLPVLHGKAHLRPAAVARRREQCRPTELGIP